MRLASLLNPEGANYMIRACRTFFVVSRSFQGLGGSDGSNAPARRSVRSTCLARVARCTPEVLAWPHSAVFDVVLQPRVFASLCHAFQGFLHGVGDGLADCTTCPRPTDHIFDRDGPQQSPAKAIRESSTQSDGPKIRPSSGINPDVATSFGGPPQLVPAVSTRPLTKAGVDHGFLLPLAP